MAKQTVEVDIPDGYEIDEQKQVEIKTWYDNDDKPTKIRMKWKLKPAWESDSVPYWDEWPEWLKGAYIAMDEEDGWHVHESKPVLDEWFWHDGNCRYPLYEEILDIKLPKCSDWTQSLRKNPYIKD